ncbi:hypothetical protein FDUTEX481_05480 [Tolypothrix sp. PCC 7601]|nr:hypothetical protein FDUTEX481_05480 [Tolypothrix sp. PCC 7601]
MGNGEWERKIQFNNYQSLVPITPYPQRGPRVPQSPVPNP